MKKYTRTILIVGIVIIIVLALILIKLNESTEPEQQPSQATSTSTTSSQPGDDLSTMYSNKTLGFSLRYPAQYIVDESYAYEELGPGKDISGVKFTIPASLSAGSNLSSDSYISVEKISTTQTCSAALFLDASPKPSTVVENGISYSVASTTGAGAGNRYDETVYVLPNTHPCIAVRYFIHYSVFENYPTGTVTRFDEQALLNQFDKIRKTLTLSK